MKSLVIATVLLVLISFAIASPFLPFGGGGGLGGGGCKCIIRPKTNLELNMFSKNSSFKISR